MSRPADRRDDWQVHNRGREARAPAPAAHLAARSRNRASIPVPRSHPDARPRWLPYARARQPVRSKALDKRDPLRTSAAPRSNVKPTRPTAAFPIDGSIQLMRHCKRYSITHLRARERIDSRLALASPHAAATLRLAGRGPAIRARRDHGRVNRAPNTPPIVRLHTISSASVGAHGGRAGADAGVRDRVRASAWAHHSGLPPQRISAAAG